MQRKIAASLLHAGAHSGAMVRDLTSSKTLYAARADLTRVPASVEKLYTTATALRRFGPSARLTTELRFAGTLYDSGVLNGNLILRGGGDPTLGSGDIDALASAASQAGLKRISGAIVGDESRFDTRRGGPSSGWGVDYYLGGSLGALTVNRGSGDSARPGRAAAIALAKELRSRGIRSADATRAGKAPTASTRIAYVRSPTIAALAKATNVPSDNFIAETLLKNLGARYGSGGTTSRGAAVVSSFLRRVGIRARVVDGSGLSRGNRTTPREVVALLSEMHQSTQRANFENSLAVAGRTGTLAGRMNGTAAEGVCRGKTGTLSDVSGLSGICRAANGHVIAFSMLMNSVSTDRARGLQDSVLKAIARLSD